MGGDADPAERPVGSRRGGARSSAAIACARSARPIAPVTRRARWSRSRRTRRSWTQASASAILAGDDVAAAVLETGVGRNVEVLRALAERVPTNASAAITRAVDAAIARSTDARRADRREPSGRWTGRWRRTDGGGGHGSPAEPAARHRGADSRAHARIGEHGDAEAQADQEADRRAARPPTRRRARRMTRRHRSHRRRRTAHPGRRRIDGRAAGRPPGRRSTPRRRATDRPATRLPCASDVRDDRIAAARRARGRTRLHRPGRRERGGLPRATRSDLAPARPRAGLVPATRRALEPSSLDAVVISHLHPDHFIDLVALRHYLHWQFKPARRVRVLAPAGLSRRIDALHDDPGFTARSLDVEDVVPGIQTVGTLTVEARRVTHTDDSHAYRVAPDGGSGPGLVYTGDCGRAEDLDALVRAGRHAAVGGVVRAGARPAGRDPPRWSGRRRPGEPHRRRRRAADPPPDGLR